jgi:hypothetical protein
MNWSVFSGHNPFRVGNLLLVSPVVAVRGNHGLEV